MLHVAVVSLSTETPSRPHALAVWRFTPGIIRLRLRVPSPLHKRCLQTEGMPRWQIHRVAMLHAHSSIAGLPNHSCSACLPSRMLAHLKASYGGDDQGKPSWCGIDLLGMCWHDLCACLLQGDGGARGSAHCFSLHDLCACPLQGDGSAKGNAHCIHLVRSLQVSWHKDLPAGGRACSCRSGRVGCCSRGRRQSKLR